MGVGVGCRVDHARAAAGVGLGVYVDLGVCVGRGVNVGVGNGVGVGADWAVMAAVAWGHWVATSSASFCSERRPASSDSFAVLALIVCASPW